MIVAELVQSGSDMGVQTCDGKGSQGGTHQSAFIQRHPTQWLATVYKASHSQVDEFILSALRRCARIGALQNVQTPPPSTWETKQHKPTIRGVSAL
jgi:hypothetical protein